MRGLTIATAAILGLALTTSSASAQSLSTLPTGGVSTIGGGAQTIVNTPVNTASANAAFPGTQSTGFLSSFFPGFSMPATVYSYGQSNYPAPSSYASTQYPSGVPVPFIPVNNVPRYLLPNGYTPSLAPGR